MEPMEMVDGKMEVDLGGSPVDVFYSGEYSIAPPFRQQDLVEWKVVATAGGRDFSMGSTLICTLPRGADRAVDRVGARPVIVRLIERSVARRIATELGRGASTT